MGQFSKEIKIYFEKAYEEVGWNEGILQEQDGMKEITILTFFLLSLA